MRASTVVPAAWTEELIWVWIYWNRMGTRERSTTFTYFLSSSWKVAAVTENPTNTSSTITASVGMRAMSTPVRPVMQMSR